jgi:hypothetical protein
LVAKLLKKRGFQVHIVQCTIAVGALPAAGLRKAYYRQGGLGRGYDDLDLGL